MPFLRLLASGGALFHRNLVTEGQTYTSSTSSFYSQLKARSCVTWQASNWYKSCFQDAATHGPSPKTPLQQNPSETSEASCNCRSRITSSKLGDRALSTMYKPTSLIFSLLSARVFDPSTTFFFLSQLQLKHRLQSHMQRMLNLYQLASTQKSPKSHGRTVSLLYLYHTHRKIKSKLPKVQFYPSGRFHILVLEIHQLSKHSEHLITLS